MPGAKRKGTTQQARRLRRDTTEAEKKLWKVLRANQLSGAKFRRQFPVGPYITDFACWEARLIIELDGGQHADSKTDAHRTRYLEGKGFRVIRFWNNEVLENLEGVLSQIQIVLIEAHPSPQPSPEGEGEKE